MEKAFYSPVLMLKMFKAYLSFGLCQSVVYYVFRVSSSVARPSFVRRLSVLRTREQRLVNEKSLYQIKFDKGRKVQWYE